MQCTPTKEDESDTVLRGEEAVANQSGEIHIASLSFLIIRSTMFYGLFDITMKLL